MNEKNISGAISSGAQNGVENDERFQSFNALYETVRDMESHPVNHAFIAEGLSRLLQEDSLEVHNFVTDFFDDAIDENVLDRVYVLQKISPDVHEGLRSVSGSIIDAICKNAGEFSVADLKYIREAISGYEQSQMFAQGSVALFDQKCPRALGKTIGFDQSGSDHFEM